MTIYLVVISLLLHGLTILWILTLMQKNSTVEVEKKELIKIKAEVEDLLFSYMNEIKEGNEQLLKELKSSKVEEQPSRRQRVPSTKTHHNQTQESFEPVVTRTRVLNKQETSSYNEYTPPNEDEIVEKHSVLYEQSDTSKVLALAKQGLSSNEIARKLNLGKGEVELILKFYR